MKTLAGLLLALTLQACASFSAVAPQTFDERVFYAESSIIAAYDTLADLVERGSLSKEKGLKIYEDIQQAEFMLDISKTAISADIADKKLQTTLRLLTEIEAKLKAAQP